jgi:transposase
MVKCNKGQLRQLKRALKRRPHVATRQRIQMVLLRESGMTQPEIAAAMGVSLSTVNRAHMAYDRGGLNLTPWSKSLPGSTSCCSSMAQAITAAAIW